MELIKLIQFIGLLLIVGLAIYRVFTTKPLENNEGRPFKISDFNRLRKQDLHQLRLLRVEDEPEEQGQVLPSS